MILVMCFGRELVLALALHEVLGRVDEEHVVGLFFALLENKDADGDAGGLKEVRGQADDRYRCGPSLSSFGADALLRPAPEEDAVGQDNRHHDLRP